MVDREDEMVVAPISLRGCRVSVQGVTSETPRVIVRVFLGGGPLPVGSGDTDTNRLPNPIIVLDIDF